MSQAHSTVVNGQAGELGAVVDIRFCLPSSLSIGDCGFWWGCLSQFPITPTREHVTSVWLVVVP